MWWQNNTRKASILGSRMVLSLLLLLLAFLPGCGYKLTGDMPSVLGDSSKTLKVKSIDQPTTYPWLSYVVRNSLRNEIAARNLAVWVDSGEADYTISIKIERYTLRSRVRDDNDTTLIFDGNITLEATIYDGHTNNVTWRSGQLFYSNTYQSHEEKAAAEELVSNVMQKLTRKMRLTF